MVPMSVEKLNGRGRSSISLPPVGEGKSAQRGRRGRQVSLLLPGGISPGVESTHLLDRPPCFVSICGNCPQNADKTWPETAKTLLPQWWEARISRQKEMDVSIAAKAVFESF